MGVLEQMKWIVPALLINAAVFGMYEASLWRPDPISLDSTQEPRPEQIHVCTHDKLVEEFEPSAIVPQNYGNSEKLVFSRIETKENGRDIHMSGFPASGAAPIRVKFNTEMLYQDSLACLPGTEKVPVGSPSSYADVCVDGTTESDCWMDCTGDLVFSDERRTRMLTDLIPFAKAHFQKFLAVKPVTGDLVLGGPTMWGSCASRLNASLVEDVHPDTDLVIVVTVRPLFGMTLAQAISCQVDGKGRPIAGWIVFRPDKMMAGIDFVRGVMTHELTHALGYSRGFMDPTSGSSDISYFINPETEVRLAAHDVVMYGNRSNPYTGAEWQVMLIKTPKVLSVIRDHFDCPTLQGAPMEDQGDPIGTQFSHWEKRIFQTEYMTGSSPWYPIFSKLTLAYLEDTGFYFIYWNHTTNEHNLRFGKDEGCSFPTVSCNEWPTAVTVPKNEYFCTDTSQQGCNFDMHAKASCLRRTTGDYYGAPFSSRYQYYADPNTGGIDMLPDWCTNLFGWSNGYCENAVDIAPSTAKATGTANFGETWGAKSRCYVSNFVKRGSRIISRSVQSNCHKTACASDTLLKLNIAGDWYDCPISDPGKVITHNDYTGTLTCPPAWKNPCGKFVTADPDWPLVHDIIPKSGSANGGYTVTLIGERFSPGSTMWVMDSQMTNVVIHGPTNATGTVQRVNNIRAKGYYPISIKDSQGRMGSAWTFEMDVITVSLSQVLEELLAFLTNYAVPLGVAGVGAVCAYSVKKEYEELRGVKPGQY